MKKWINCAVRLNTNNKQINLSPRKKDLDWETLDRLSKNKSIRLRFEED